MADASSSSKPDINNKVWQNIIRRHLFSTAQAVAGNYDGDVTKIRQRLQEVKSGSVKFHDNATGQGFAELQAGNSGKYSLSPAQEEAIIKEVADKLSQERLAKAEHALAQEKWIKSSKEVRDKLNKEAIETDEKLKKKFGKDIAGYNSAKSKADKEMEIKIKKAELEFEQKRPKAKSPLGEQVTFEKNEGHALAQHRRILLLPEDKRAEALKNQIKAFSTPIDDTPESKAQSKHIVKRLQELAAEDGVTKPRLARGIAAVGGAVKKAANAATSAIPGTGPVVNPPSAVVRPTTTTNTVPPAPAPAPAPAASTPPPAGLPPPPSAAPAPAANTPPPANLPPPPSASANQPPATPRVWTGPNTRMGDATPPTTSANPAGTNYPAAGREGVVGVSDEGVRVALEGDDVKGRKWEPRVGKTIPAVTPSESRPSGPVNTVPYGTTTPLKPDSAKGRSGVVVTDASGNKKVGFVSTQVPVRPTVAPPIENPSILSDLVGPIVESAKMIGGVAGKGTMDVVSGAANLIKKAVVPTNPRDILRGNTEAAKAKAPTTEAKPAPDNLPKYAYGYDPLTGKQTAGPAKSTSYGHLSSRVSILRDRNLVPFLSGRNAADLKNELAARHGASDLETFLQKAVNRSGLFTATEAGQVVQQLKSDPIFKGLIDAGMPVDRPKGPFKAGGAPKVEVKDAQGNVLPKGNAVPKATPPVETARDRLDAIRKAEAQRIAAEQARVAAEQAAETQRVATATAAFTEEQRLAAQAEAERKAIIEAFQNRSPAGNEPSFPAGTRFGEALPFVGNSGVTRQDRLRQISAENKKGVTVDEVLLQRWLKNRTATSTPESQAATGKPAPYIRGMERGVKPPSRGAMLAGQVGGAALQGVGFAPDVFNAARLLRGGAITPDGQILSQTEQMTAAIERMKNLGKPVQPVEDTPWYVNLANLPVEMAKQSWDDIQAIGKFGKYEKTKAQETEEALQRFVDEANARRLYGIPRDGETF